MIRVMGRVGWCVVDAAIAVAALAALLPVVLLLAVVNTYGPEDQDDRWWMP